MMHIGLAGMWARCAAGPFAVFWSKGIKGSKADFFVGFATVIARFAVSVANFCFLLSDLDERHLAAVLLGNDKILPYRPLMSFRFHPVATTQRRFRLNFWDQAKVAVPLPSQTSCNGE